jgi:hypothetical protein
MAFGFVVERCGLFLLLLGRDEIKVFRRHIFFTVGEAPAGYNLHVGMLVNALIGMLGFALSLYLAR